MVTMDFHRQISELVEDELFSLSVLYEIESSSVVNQNGHYAFHTKIVLEHKIYVKPYCLVSLPL